MRAPTPDRPLLVVAATEMEWRAWRRGLGLGRLPAGRAVRGEGRPSLALLRTGIGLARATAAAAAIEDLRPSRVLHVGFVGALRSGLGAGDLLLETGTSPGHCAPGTSALPDPLPVDEALLDALRQPLARLPDRLAQGPLLTVDRFVHRAEDKTALGVAGSYLACEMEACTVREAAERAGAVYAGVRAISDSCDHDMPPPLRDPSGRPAPGRALAWGLRPRAGLDLLRMLSGGRRAWTALGRALPVAVEALQ